MAGGRSKEPEGSGDEGEVEGADILMNVPQDLWLAQTPVLNFRELLDNGEEQVIS